MNFWPEFINLKTAIGGNREQQHFENTFGMPFEELNRITMPNAHNKRIIGELEFAIRLNEAKGGIFDDCICQALSYLTSEMKDEGVLSKTACNKAESMLLPCSAAAKEYKLILAGHAHIDMDWMWSYHETVSITLSTFRTVLNLMNQYPDFCFSQSQASVYKIVEEYDPELMPEIQARIKEGRWEVTASAWVETDKNMPNTESLLRHIQCTKDYLRDSWGIDPDSLELDFSPDTFGHSANVPEIDQFGGVKYMYHCRALDGDISLYRWRAPSGKELLNYVEQYWYNSGIDPRIAQGIFDICKQYNHKFKTGLIVYGVGDHGGGPTRRDIEAAIEMAKWPVFPTIKFGTITEFFKEAEAIREELPIVDHELNYFAPGCYTTQTRIKRGNRRSETTLNDAESFMSVAQIEAGKTFNKARHDKAWQDVLYTHFHDILTGSCVQDSREHAMGNFSNTLAYAQTQYSKSITALAAMVDTSSIQTDFEIALTQAEGAGGGFGMSYNIGENLPSGLAFNNGVPNPERGCGLVRIYNIFNPLGIARKAVTELTVWDWVGDLRRIQFKDADGNPLRFQLLDSDLQVYWDHRFIRILVECDVPALGYATIVMSQAEATGYTAFRNSTRRSSGTHDDYVLENEMVKAVFHRITGCLISFVDKATGAEYIDGSRPVGLSVITMQRIGTSAWNIGKYLKIEPMDKPINIERLSGGDLRQSFTATYKWGMSTMKVTPMLVAGEKAIRFNINADWSEVAGETVPLLFFDVPTSFTTDKFLMDVPAGAIYRQPRNDDMPGLQYCAAIREDGSALALITDSKYGYRANADHFGVSIINTSTNPDPYPDRGQHIVNMALAISQDNAMVLENTAREFNHCTQAVSNNSHPGSLPLGLSFLDFQAESSVLSSVLPTEETGTIHVRFYETCGKDDTVVLKLAKAPVSAVSVDLFGKEQETGITVNGNEVRIPVKAHAIGEVELKF